MNRRLIRLLVAAVVVTSVLALGIPASLRSWLSSPADQEMDSSRRRDPQTTPESDAADVFRVAQVTDNADRGVESADATSSPIELPPSLFESIRDHTPSRHQEQEAWFRTLAAMKATTFKVLWDRATIVVGFRELSQQPTVYRGQWVRMHGTVHRIHRLAAPANDVGIDHYWQCWLRPVQANDPIVVYTTDLPPEFVEGMDLSYSVDVVGVFFKLWAYPSTSGLRTAPLVLGRIAPTRDLGRAGGRDGISTTRDRGLPKPVPLVHQEPDTGDDRPVPLAEFWELLGFDEAWWQQFVDGPDLNDTERLAMIKLLHGLNRVPRSSLERDQQRDLGVDDWFERSAELRGGTVLVQGRILSWQELDDGSFRNTIALDNSNQLVDVVTPPLPRMLQSVANLLADVETGTAREPVSATAVHLKTTGTRPDGRPLLAAPRLAWHPDQLDPNGILVEDHLFLAGLGFDVGLLEDVTSRSELQWHDREAFYQLLAALSQPNRAELDAATGSPILVSQLLQSEELYRGRLCTFVGNGRSVTRVAIDDPDIRFRFGIDHYYEVVVFVQPDVPIQFVGPDDERMDFATYPIVFCCREIPPQLPVGQDEHVLVQVRGVFLKNWAYASPFASGVGAETGAQFLQLSPLVVGFSPEIVPVPVVKTPGLDRLVLALFLGGLIGLVTLIWWFGRQDRRAEQHRRAGRLPERIELPPDAD